MNRIVIDGIAKRYREVEALHPITLTLEPGITGLLGPTARANRRSCGYSQRSVARAAAAYAGTAPTCCASPTPCAAAWDICRKMQASIRNSPPTNSCVTWRRSKASHPELHRAKIDALIERLNLGPARSRPLGGFSGGMRQRVGIAQALLGEPQIVIVDEPTVGLDPEERVRFRGLITELARERIVLLSTHIVSDVEAAASRIVILSGGRVRADGPPEAVTGAYGNLERAYMVLAGGARAA